MEKKTPLFFEGSTSKIEGLSQVPGPYHFPKVKSWRSFLSSERRRMVDEFQVRAEFFGGGWLVGWGSNFRSRFSQWVVVSGAALVKCNSNYLVGGFKCVFLMFSPFLGWKIPILKFWRAYFSKRLLVQPPTSPDPDVFSRLSNLLVAFGHAMIMGSRCSNSTIESVLATLRGWAPDPVVHGVK